MPPKPRSPERVGLVSNLYERDGYYSWRDPRTGREFGIGRDRQDAIDQAIEANREILGRGSLIERVSIAPPGRTIDAFVPVYLERLKARKLADTTLTHRRLDIATIRRALGAVPVGPRQEDAVAITEAAATWLATYTAAGKLRMAKQLRSALIDLCAEMGGAGWLAVNPAKIIKLEAPEVRRQRLTLEHFQRILRAAEGMQPWVRNSMLLAVVTLQRREDVAGMQFRHERAGRLEVVQHKSRGRTRLRINPGIRLDAIGVTIGEAIARCRDQVVSAWMLHHAVNQGQAKAGKRVHPQTIGNAFAEARDLAGIEVEAGKTPPTFHELRSLGARLYRRQGYDPQALMGHRDPATTAVYTDDRGAEWIEVAARFRPLTSERFRKVSKSVCK